MTKKSLKLKPILETIIASEAEDPFVVQIKSLQKKNKKTSDGKDFYVAHLSDSKIYISCKFSDKISDLVDKKLIKIFSLLKVTKYKILRKNNLVIFFIADIKEYENQNDEIGKPEKYGSISQQTKSMSLKEENMKRQKFEEEKENNKREEENIQMTNIKTISPIRSMKLTLAVLSKNKSEKVINCVLSDGNLKIKLVGFGEAISKIDILECGSIYDIQNYSTRLTRIYDDKSSSGLFKIPESEYEIMASPKIEIAKKGECHNLITKEISKIKDIVQFHENSTKMNILGYITAVYDITEVITKNQQKKIKKRDIRITDFSTDEQTKMTLWEPFCNLNLEKNCVYFFGNFGTNSYNEIISYANQRTSCIIKEPKIKETEVLYKESEGKLNNLKTEGSMKTSKIQDSFFLKNILRDSEISYSGEKRDTKNASIFSSILDIQGISAPDGFYFACNDCKKKIILDITPQDLTDVTGHCNSCEETKMCIPKVVMRFVLSDFSSSIYCTFFSDVVESLLQTNIGVLYQMYISEPRDFMNLMKSTLGKEIKVVLKKSLRNYNGADQEHFVALKAEYTDSKEIAKEYIELLEIIEKK